MASTVLVVTALEDFTADKVIAALNARAVPVVRVDPADIGPALSFGFRIGADSPAWGGRLRTASREVELGEVAAVYYRRPTPYAARYGHLPPQQRDFAVAEARPVSRSWTRRNERSFRPHDLSPKQDRLRTLGHAHGLLADAVRACSEFPVVRAKRGRSGGSVRARDGALAGHTSPGGEG